MEKNMTILSKVDFDSITRQYQKSYDALPFLIDTKGLRQESSDMVDNLPALVNVRANGLSESVRWGEYYIFFLMPNVISWVVPLVSERKILGGIIGGEVIYNVSAYDQMESVNHLTSMGIPQPIAQGRIDRLPLWTYEKSQKAAEFLFNTTCSAFDWDMSLLNENRKKSQRQRQIAEEIHRRKQGQSSRTLRDDELTLLSLMKAGDQKGARRELNKTLGALFSHTADIRLLKAHVIEMMGYLVRSAIENSPQLSSLIEKNHAWMAAIIDTKDFETLTNAVADALDDFMWNIYTQGQNRTSEKVTKILEFLNNNFYDHITLETLSEEIGLSRFRIAHIFKEQTGKTVLQHIQQLRVQEAQRLLEQSNLSCTDIAYQAGFGDQSYFTKQFRKWLGVTPARYRKLYYSGKSDSQD